MGLELATIFIAFLGLGILGLMYLRGQAEYNRQIKHGGRDISASLRQGKMGTLVTRTSHNEYTSIVDNRD